MARIRCDRTPVWSELKVAFEAGGKYFDVRTAFAQDINRFARFSQEAPYVFADLSKNLMDADTEALLMKLAAQCGVEAHRDAMFAGEAINTTEQRAVWHTLLRNPPLAPAQSAQAAINFVAIYSVGAVRHVPFSANRPYCNPATSQTIEHEDGLSPTAHHASPPTPAPRRCGCGLALQPRPVRIAHDQPSH